MKLQNLKVSAIVPVFNEGKRVGKVIDTLLSSNLINEIVSINDGSSDNSLEVLKKFGNKIKLINFKQNQGKGRAVAAGIKKATGQYLFFCDSDLINLTTDHINKIFKPILKGKTKVVFAVPTKHGNGKYERHEVYLAGERVYPRSSVAPHISKLSRTKGAGGSEIILNTLFSKKEIKIVPLKGLVKPAKTNKWPRSMALKQYLLSTVGVLQESGRIEINSMKDLKQLENLIQVDTFDGLIAMINQIKNQKIRTVLKKYFLKYITKYIRKILD
ncbi:MAG: glycosyltransferase family 2 protein [Candidatus Levybacteria bacterium]|nr:glycosyltransferase family 2 protein [Candidatus Levybacteria bacterium]